MYDEAPFARAIAKYIGTDHTEFYCTIRQAQEIIPELPYFFDEPFADSSAIPTILVSRLASDKVKVALSADAGDELFAGYSHYKIMADRLKSMKMVPETLVCPVNFLLRATGKILLAEHTALKYKFDGLSEVLQKDNFSRASKLMRLASQIPKQFKEALFIDKPVPYPSVFDINSEDFINEIEIAMAIDYKIYLQDDILTKVDRATMSASIEGREPFLDHRLAEFAAQLPLSYKFDGNNGKRILKDIVHDYIPVSLMDRPKTGFSLPIYDWLLGDLNYIIDEYLNDKALLASGLFNVEFVKSQIKRFRTGNMQFNTLIWKLIIFQMWFQRWID
jgi:asparagine synthase (glutamine-hydrolysing)